MHDYYTNKRAYVGFNHDNERNAAMRSLDNLYIYYHTTGDYQPGLIIPEEFVDQACQEISALGITFKLVNLNELVRIHLKPDYDKPRIITHAVRALSSARIGYCIENDFTVCVAMEDVHEACQRLERGGIAHEIHKKLS